ncbi:peptidoglycan-binding protein [Lewinella sp. LCG006]|uniref:peptidoglycan-binding domain-containing protein n=1 Tax=Lewinella sp. LCG006 TaxID=3231911 RepID=UPI0034606677
MPIFAADVAGTEKLKSIRLGAVDEGAKPADTKKFFERYHKDFIQSFSMARTHFRDEATSDWNAFVTTGKTDYVSSWQAFLRRAGFLPFHQENGIFGYVTLAGTRLFQEYVRTIEGIEEIGVPDGIVGGKTRFHAHRWDQEGKVCHWWRGENPPPTQEYQMWMDLLHKAKAHYQAQPHPVVKAVSERQITGDTLKVDDWQWKPEDVHLVGIRRNQEQRDFTRGNDDLFLLLIRGLVFKFYGSTDPRPKGARTDEAYLVEGQHKYRMAWHKIGDIKKVYKALKPYSGAGVMVFRDKDGDDDFDEEDIKFGIQGPNNTINIHWTGSGISNYSQGCQVIAGSSYLNSDEQLIDCSAFASPLYEGLSQGRTRGAYNVLTDLVLAYTPLDVDTVWYTLGRDEVLDLHPDLGANWSAMMVKNMEV